MLYTEYPPSHEYLDIKFRGVEAHQFMNVRTGQNVVFDIVEQSADEFYDKFDDPLRDLKECFLSLDFQNKPEFISEFSKLGRRIYDIQSSFGLTGWVVAADMCFERRDAKAQSA